VDILRARHIELTWAGELIRAHIGLDPMMGIDGFGSTVPDALHDLANRIERDRAFSIWVPRKAKQYVEGGMLKTNCPECGHTHEMPEFDSIIAYVCDACGAGVDVERRSRAEDS
jgi:hypothetical protein